MRCRLDAVPTIVTTDGDRLRQILSNLISNAIKFTPAGTVALNVRGVTREGRQFVEFHVEDSGIGIAPEDQALIFEAFTQVNNSTNRDYSGTGLGLAISKRLANAMGGDIAVESALGVGSRFVLTLPVEIVDAQFAQLSAEGDAAPQALAQASLLMVERNVAHHALMRMLLTPEARSIEMVASADEAIDRLGQAHFDHVIIEAASAGSENLAALDGIRAIIAASGSARTTLLAAPTEELGIQTLIGAGAQQLILKPIGASELIAQIKAIYQADEAQGDPVAVDAVPGAKAARG